MNHCVLVGGTLSLDSRRIFRPNMFHSYSCPPSSPPKKKQTHRTKGEWICCFCFQSFGYMLLCFIESPHKDMKGARRLSQKMFYKPRLNDWFQFDYLAKNYHSIYFGGPHGGPLSQVDLQVGGAGGWWTWPTSIGWGWFLGTGKKYGKCPALQVLLHLFFFFRKSISIFVKLMDSLRS